MTPSLLTPGSRRAAAIMDDSALVPAMLRAELAWMHALADGGAATPDQVTAVEEAAARLEPGFPQGEIEDAGNPVPHKQNPVLSIAARSAAVQAPQLAAQLHLCAAQSLEQRAPGNWHAEWPALRRLLGLTVTSSSQGADPVAGLEADARATRRRAEKRRRPAAQRARRYGRPPGTVRRPGGRLRGHGGEPLAGDPWLS